MHAGYATSDSTARYAAQFPAHQANGFFREAQSLTVSSLGIGSYLGNLDSATDDAYTEAVTEAIQAGINFIDTSLNYRHQASERAIARALAGRFSSGTPRAALTVCTKAGFLVPGAFPGHALAPDDIVGGMHSMAPAFLRDQLDRSRANLGLDTIDVFYLHNPETQLSHIPRQRFDERLQAAFETCEALAAEGRIQWYGAATWNGFRTRDAAEGLSLTAMETIARHVAGPGHRFRFIQLPVNLAMLEAAAYLRENGRSVLETARALGITAIASASLLQARLANGLPAGIAGRLPGPSTDAQRAIQFTRSVDGIAVALTGMASAAHVRENLGIAAFPPASLAGTGWAALKA
jgi:aryl-alcohol dehydrogenase-like predicted oxidoreductase